MDENPYKSPETEGAKTRGLRDVVDLALKAIALLAGTLGAIMVVGGILAFVAGMAYRLIKAIR